MTTIRFYFADDRAGPKFQRGVQRQGDLVREAARASAIDAITEIRRRGAADIKAAGKFGSRWTDGLDAKVSEGGGNIRIEVSHAVPYFSVFQFGKVIRGKPLLWIPLSFAADAQGVYARDFGSLFRVDRKGGKAPLLLAPGKPAQPKYFAKESVTIPKKFRTIEIVAEVARGMAEIYRARRAG